MTHSEHSDLRWYRIGYAPVLTLAAMAALVAVATYVPGVRLGAVAVRLASGIASFGLLLVFVRQGEHRGASRTPLLIIGSAVYLASATIVFLLRMLWSSAS